MANKAVNKITSYWKDRYSAIMFHLDAEGTINTVLYSKVYPNGKKTKDWSYVKVGFGASGDYQQISEEEFKQTISKFN